MSHRAYALSLAAAILVIAGALAAGSLGLEPFSGDLTRIGRFDEAEYGWIGAQTRFAKPLFQTSPARIDHDIVVLGDSFSNDGETSWPNYVAGLTGARVATFHVRGKSWRDLVDDPSYRASPPKVFVLEIVERDLKQILGAAPSSCGGRAPSPRVRLAAMARDMSPERAERPTRRSLAQLDPRQFTQFQWARLLRRHGRSTGEVVQVALTRRAFSSRRGDSTLVYTGDVLKRFWTASDLAAMDCALRRIQDAVQRDGRTLFLAMLIPDKLTAYSPLLADPTIAGLGVLDRLDPRAASRLPVARDLERAILAGTPDVYLPDDSHLGAAGQEILARTLLDELRRRGALPPASEPRPTAN